jgi:hypothetical protein
MPAGCSGQDARQLCWVQAPEYHHRETGVHVDNSSSNDHDRKIERLPPVGFTRLDTLTKSAFGRMRRRTDGREGPCPVPWPGVSEVLSGGLWPGLSFLVGNPSSGKTQLALQLALHVASVDLPVLYLVLEGKVHEFLARSSAVLGGGAWRELWLGRRSGYPLAAERHDFAEQICREKLKGRPFYLKAVQPYQWSCQQLDQLVGDLKTHHQEQLVDPKSNHQIKPMLVVLDFFRLVGGRDETNARIQQVVTTAHEVALTHEVVVLVVCNTSKEHYDLLDGRLRAGMGPKLGSGDPGRLVGFSSALGESENSSELVLVLSRDRYEEAQPVWLAVAKNQTGATSWIKMSFDGSVFKQVEG